ncbi:MAG: redoxin domain-containing protein [Candidatus Rokubacteria bacterium]|nr:redoxin domain-containing protein [Candidatus Rokubacteria bacterium]
MITLLYGTRPPHRAAAAPEGRNLWLSAHDFAAATGWELKPEGFCQADRCVRIPPGRGIVDGQRVNLSAFADLLEHPVVRDEAHGVWALADAAPARRAALQSLEAPDFTLPDLDGRPHALSEYRGKKVFLVSWASW